MSSEIIINNANVGKVVNVINKVNIKYYDNNVLKYDTYQTPGDILEYYNYLVYNGLISDYKKYSILYDWMHGAYLMPTLVPNANAIYNAYISYFFIPDASIIILYNNGNQTMNDQYIMNSTEQLYFDAYTMTDVIKKKVLVDAIVTYDSTLEKYFYDTSFTILNPDYQGGANKNYSVTLEIYKDHLKTKYLGEIIIQVQLVNSIGPGE